MSVFGRLFILSLILAAVAGCTRSGELEPILIGNIAPSGPDKVTSQHAKQALLLAVEEVNQEENRILGRRVEVVHVDPFGKLDPALPEADRLARINETLQAEAVRLITVTHVSALLGASDLTQAERVGRAAQPYEVALVTPAGLPPQLISENVFSVNAGLAFQGRVLAKFTADQLKVDHVALLVDSRQSASEAVASAFLKEFSKGNGKQVVETFYKGEAEFAEIVANLGKAPVKALIYAGTAADWMKLQGRLRMANVKLPLVFANGAEQLAALLALGEANKDMYLTMAYLPEGGSEANQHFNRKYQERFHEPPDQPAALAYDGIRVVFEGLRRAKTQMPSRVRAELANSSDNPFDSLTGSLTFAKGHSVRRPLSVVRLENGRLTKQQTYDSDGME